MWGVIDVLGHPEVAPWVGTSSGWAVGVRTNTGETNMTKRRKFLIGLGALAAGSAAGIGTGAFSSATIPDRGVEVQVEQDDVSTIALVPGEDPDIFIDDEGQLSMNLTGSDERGEPGVNINSRYTWGDHDDPANDYAFKVVNNDESTYNDVTLEYEVEHDGWIDNSTSWDNESFLRFTVYGFGYSTDMKAPNNQLSTPNPVSRSVMGPHSWLQFAPGDEWYVVVDADTTGTDAAEDDDLSGTLSIEVSDRD